MARRLLCELMQIGSHPSLIMKIPRKGRLTRELVVVLLVKLALIVTIKLVYFSDAEKPDSADVAKALLAASPRPTERNDHP
jgi:hypothetical protein